MLVESMGQKKMPRMRWLPAIVALALTVPALAVGTGPSYAQGGTRLFPETGKTVKGAFLAYWDGHGGLPQQGFPISEEMSEVSETDGKSYTVQYFERAVFELHPELPAPNNVLLSLLGNFLYKQKYPSGAPNQQPSADLNFQIFNETGKRVGGKFLDYWKSHGGLAQQGFPISEEFLEVSSLDGKSYKVQYFERAVFELHLENQPPYDVLLSQLGKFRYDAKYGKGGPQPTTPPNQPTAQPTARPTTPPAASCDLGGGRNGTATPNQVKPGGTIVFEATGFIPGENVSFWFTAPDGSVAGTARPLCCAEPDGKVRFEPLQIPTSFADFPGRWALTVQGAISGAGRSAVIPFCVTK
ncbi:MAG TPA: hypothetical protein VGE45_22645 [Chloroflexia bacterium]|jgi:hypothetical protein